LTLCHTALKGHNRRRGARCWGVTPGSSNPSSSHKHFLTLTPLVGKTRFTEILPFTEISTVCSDSGGASQLCRCPLTLFSSSGNPAVPYSTNYSLVQCFFFHLPSLIFLFTISTRTTLHTSSIIVNRCPVSEEIEPRFPSR